MTLWDIDAGAGAIHPITNGIAIEVLIGSPQAEDAHVVPKTNSRLRTSRCGLWSLRGVLPCGGPDVELGVVSQRNGFGDEGGVRNRRP